MKGRLRLIEECIRMKEAIVDGMWLMPRIINDSDEYEYVWDGVFFCRQGPLAPSVVRFYIDANSLFLFNGITMSIPYSLLEAPLKLQQWIRTLIEDGRVHYVPLQTLTFEYLFGSSVPSSIVFKDTKSLSELDALLLSK